MKVYNYTRYVTNSLSDEPNYYTNISLEGNALTLVCGYNTRNKKRWIYIKDRSDRVLLTQTFLKVGKKCEFNFMSDVNNLSFYVTLKPKDLNKKFSNDYDYLSWSKDFNLSFVGRGADTEEALRVNGRKYYVGN